MNKVRGHGKGNVVFTWKDFHDFGPRGSVDQALARLANAGKLRRVARGMYDLPRTSKLLSGPAPANADAVIDAVQRHDQVTIKPDDLAAANAFGLTTAVLVQPRYRTSGGRRTIKVGRSTIKLRPAGRKLELWLDTPAAPIVQALVWLHDRKLDHDDKAIAKLRDRSTPAAREALARGLHTLPGWAIPLARNIAGNHANLIA